MSPPSASRSRYRAVHSGVNARVPVPLDVDALGDELSGQPGQPLEVAVQQRIVEAEVQRRPVLREPLLDLRHDARNRSEPEAGPHHRFEAERAFRRASAAPDDRQRPGKTVQLQRQAVERGRGNAVNVDERRRRDAVEQLSGPRAEYGARHGPVAQPAVVQIDFSRLHPAQDLPQRSFAFAHDHAIQHPRCDRARIALEEHGLGPSRDDARPRVRADEPAQPMSDQQSGKQRFLVDAEPDQVRRRREDPLDPAVGEPLEHAPLGRTRPLERLEHDVERQRSHGGVVADALGQRAEVRVRRRVLREQLDVEVEERDEFASRPKLTGQVGGTERRRRRPEDRRLNQRGLHDAVVPAGRPRRDSRCGCRRA